MSENTRIAAISIAGGESEPFYSATLRVLFRDFGTYSKQVVKEVAGLRVLLADADAEPVENGGSYRVHRPLLLRGYVRPQKHATNPGVTLRLEGQGGPFAGTLIPDMPVNDVMLLPIGGWPRTLTREDPQHPVDIEDPKHPVGIVVPQLRLTAGVVPAALAVDGQPLQKFLNLVDVRGHSTLFGGFRLEKPAIDTLPLTLVPQGIEFDGSLPDPTRDLLDARDPLLRIRGRFRLEGCIEKDRPPRYWLRLIGGHPDEPRAMEQLEARIARAFGDLGSDKNAPLAVRFDRRPRVPPLLWPLTFSKSPHEVLELTKTVAGDFEMAFEPSAIEARLRTVSRFPGDLPGIAAIDGEHLTWRKQEDGFDVVIAAGPNTASEPKVGVEFKKHADAGWTTILNENFEPHAIEVSLDATAARLLAAYKSGQVVATTATRPPYAFLPLADGWLQLGLEKARRPKRKKAVQPPPPSIMSGRIIAANANGLRGIVIDAAERIELTMEWRKQNSTYRPTSGTLKIAGGRGQLRGFVFVAESAPTAAEALPDLRRGPAATRDVPISFNSPQLGLVLKGQFTWKGNHWKLQVTELVQNLTTDTTPEFLPSPDLSLCGYGWQVPHDLPFITNYPLTRAALTPAEPSVSRGLLRYEFEGPFMLESAGEGDAPSLTVTRVLPNPPLGQKNEGGSFFPDTIVLTTLPGTEFVVPQEWPTEKGQFKAALRHDLPVLDELFAWADPPPPPKSATLQPAAATQSLIVTALDPVRLEEVWRQSRVRMALTHTQDAFMTNWAETGKEHKQDITTLVQPYTWKEVRVKIDLTKPWGAFTVANEPYDLDTALAGISGEFVVVNTELRRRSVIPGGAIVVCGNAASLFTREDCVLVWDSRGTGLADKATTGVRPVGLDLIQNNQLQKWRGELLTPPTIETIKIDGTIPWMSGAKLAFFVRDLPIEKGVFDGESNPVESALGTVGQAFERSNFPRALHEWRLFDKPEAADAQHSPKPHDLRFGPFLFRPLRLLRVERDHAGTIELIKVIGAMRIGLRPKQQEGSGPEQGPFGADRIYDRADLLLLTLTRKGESWTPKWDGIKLAPSLKHKDTPGAHSPLTFDATSDPNVTCEASLKIDASKGIRSRAPHTVAATIGLNLATGDVRLCARLFGRACDLTSRATIGKTIQFAFEPTRDAEAAPSHVLLRIDKIAVTLGDGSHSISVDGALQVMPKKTKTPDVIGKPEEAAALLHIGRDRASFRWLDLPAADLPAADPIDQADRTGLFIDHASGRVSVEWHGAWTQAQPLFGLEACDWKVSAWLEAFVASDEPLNELAPLAVGSAWARIAGRDKDMENRIDHRLRADVERVAHHLDVTWEVGFTSPVSWPVNGLRQDDGNGLPPAWREPKDADSQQAGRSRKIQINAGDTLTHGVKARFRRQRIETGELKRVAGRITPRDPISLLVEVEHTLVHDRRSATFTTLDHVAITSFHLIMETAQAHGFAPRGARPRYRGQDTLAQVPHAGIVRLPWAVSGFYDEALIRLYSTDSFKPHLHAPLFLGGSAVQFPYRDGAEQFILTAVVPWAGIEGALGDMFKLTQASGKWEVAAADLWGGSAHRGPSALRAIVVPSRAESSEILSAIGGADLVPAEATATLERVMPVEQLFFENLRQGSNGRLEIGGEGGVDDVKAAPFFLRALTAIEARWNATPVKSEVPATWRALSLQPARGDAAGTKADSVVAVEIRPARLTQEPVESSVPADLVALSSVRMSSEHAYRLVKKIDAEDAGDLKPRAELVARARDLDRFAECAIQEVDRGNEMPGISVVEIPSSRVLRGPRYGILIDHPVLAPSPSLGWPSTEAVEGLDKLAPRLGAERPVQSAEAGFAARFRQLGLPGTTTDVMNYLGFSHRVAYQHDLRVPFVGPAARHLSPVNTRLRAPIDESFDAQPTTGPILPPFFELATIGRRPGVFEVVTAAVTVVAENDAFDREHARFGRPANSGPVVAHQLRTPRSPALPDDKADIAVSGRESDVLAFRRRTYLSLADGKRDRSGLFVLERFGTFANSADVIRREEGDTHLRVALSLTELGAPQTPTGLIGPNWNGQLAIKVDAVAANIKDTKSALEKFMANGRVRLEVGAASFDMKDKSTPTVEWPTFNWFLTVTDQLQAAREAMRRATVDVPIRLVVTFGSVEPSRSAAVRMAIPTQPLMKAILPLALDPGDRRVLRSRTRTIAFGDPSYDRQLGSKSEGDIKQIGGARALLAVDRQEYDPGSTLYFACDTIDPASGLFESVNSNAPYKVRFRRFGRPSPGGNSPAPEKLFVVGGPDSGANGEGYELSRYVPYELSLRLLRRVGSGVDDVSPLEPGDRLEVSADLANSGETKTLTVFVNIVAVPVIAPPPCVYTVIESKNGERPVSRVVLHAAAPLPQHIEHPGLHKGLAQGYVSRRALFVWRYASIEAEDPEKEPHIDLVKFDRSGGAQLPSKVLPHD